MLLPDVTEILDDPEVGGGQSFQVIRRTVSRGLGTANSTETTYNVTGNIQPQDLSAQTSTSEDTETETIVIYAIFSFQTGENDGNGPYTSADEILYDGKRYRVTRVNNWSKWGFSIAYATRVMVYTEPEVI
ncbi:MAG: hypothetical protein J6Y20_00620 [Lachnospiraceae bacterium]|nr:hypothetical protein [Lachnospiraceae bacterium]